VRRPCHGFHREPLREHNTGPEANGRKDIFSLKRVIWLKGRTQ
jgi:hypothetical protein